ncbi:MAG: class I SAM-dependent methyltransferase [Armatimonadetes bacterium]|nr:class I SAM-dependent methyltransferase [Armatimonadota bacterium]
MGVDIVLDVQAINLPSESVGTVIIVDVLEHVENPRKAVEEAYRILNKNGILIISSVMNFPIHYFPYDYWRFTPDAFKSILKPFNTSLVSYAGESNFPHTIIGIGFKGKTDIDIIEKLTERIENWKVFWNTPPRRSLNDYIKLLIPPIFLKIFNKILVKYKSIL